MMSLSVPCHRFVVVVSLPSSRLIVVWADSVGKAATVGGLWGTYSPKTTQAGEGGGGEDSGLHLWSHIWSQEYQYLIKLRMVAPRETGSGSVATPWGHERE
ncbi:hypothetical protein EDB92DRAFT_1879505 [Lactarius akahatsu]|uniref:Secreted protein n=1 Tax=Lactarius akahatsu TaxID=416441 RepID=A0AAD4LE78_9AGAM|nr:hypothetical protein EDB92DRAFT_1879505 [Lactarius akahatsu]